MSPRSLDPISRRPEKPDGKSGSSRATNEKAGVPIPHTADRDKLLERAQASIQEKKNKKAAGRRRRLVLATLALLIVFIGLASYVYVKNYKDISTFAIIDGKKLSKKDYDEFIQQAEAAKISRQDATNKYLEVQKKKIVAEKFGIQPTEDSSYFIAKQLYRSKNYNQLNSWEQLNVYDESLKLAIEFSKRGGYQGAIFYLPFAYHQETLGAAFANNIPAGWRDPQVIAQDKAYATQKVNEYYSQIKSGASEAEVISKIIQDKQLQYAGASNGSHVFSMSIDPVTKTPGEMLAYGFTKVTLAKDIPAESLKGSSSVGLSEIKTGQMIFYDKPGAPKYDAYFYFYRIDKYIPPNPDIQKQFDSSVQGLRVQTNG